MPAGLFMRAFVLAGLSSRFLYCLRVLSRVLAVPAGLFMRQLFVPVGFATSFLLCLRVLLRVLTVPAGLFMRELFVLAGFVTRFYCACGFYNECQLCLRVCL